MNAGIVERLRVWSDNAKEQDVTEIVVGLCQAADEIERLRKERDEARREVCELKLVNAYDYATDRGWDCFKEEP